MARTEQAPEAASAPAEKYLSLNQLSQQTNLPRAFLKREADEGRLPYIKAGHSQMFPLARVLAALAELASQPKPPKKKMTKKEKLRLAKLRKARIKFAIEAGDRLSKRLGLSAIRHDHLGPSWWDTLIKAWKAEAEEARKKGLYTQRNSYDATYNMLDLYTDHYRATTTAPSVAPTRA